MELSQFTGLGLLNQPLLKQIEYHDLVSTSLYYANKVKDGKGVLDTDTYIVVWTTTPFTVTASRGLTVGAEFDYVVVKPAGSDRKYVVASEPCQAFLKKSVGKMLKSLRLTKKRIEPYRYRTPMGS